MDPAFYTYGCGILSCFDLGRRQRRRFSRSYVLWRTAFLQLFLVNYLLQSRVVSRGFYLACGLVDFDNYHNGAILQNIKARRVSYDPVRIMGSFRRISELLNISHKQMMRRAVNFTARIFVLQY